MAHLQDQGSRYFGATVFIILLSTVMTLALYLPYFLGFFGPTALAAVLLAVLVLLYAELKLMLLADRIGAGRGDSRYSRAGILFALSTNLTLLFINVPPEILRGSFSSARALAAASGAGTLAVFAWLCLLRPRAWLPFAVSFTMFALYAAGLAAAGDAGGLFLLYLVFLGVGAVFGSQNQAICYFLAANAVLAAVALGGAPARAGAGGEGARALVVEWGFSTYVSVFVLLLTRFATGRRSRSELSEATLAEFMGSTPNLTVMADGSNRITHISRPLADLARIEDHELAVGRPVIDLFAEMEMKLLISEIITSPGFFYRTVALARDGRTRHFKIISDRLGGEAGGRFIDISDVSEIMDAKLEAERSNAAKSVFLAKMSHEIRTPMNAIIGMTDLMLRAGLPEESRERALEVKRAGASLLAIINDILDLSKIESGRLDICEEDYDFGTLLRDTVDVTRFRAAEKRLPFAVNVAAGMPRGLAGDPVRVRQILVNIISNAVKYTESGHVTLDAGYRHAADGLLELSFAVSDTGIGIRNEDAKRLFTEFTQFDQTRNRGIEGTGLGLAIARNLARAMGGDVSVSSAYGQGSTFRVVIQQRLRDPAPLALVRDAGSRRVALLDDRPFHARAFAAALDGLGVPHAACGDLAGLERLLLEGPCGLVLAASRHAGGARRLLGRLGLPAPLVETGEAWDDRAGRGAGFLALPVLPSALAAVLNGEAAAQGRDPASDPSVTFRAPGASILVVDDIRTNLVVAKGLLAPYQAETVLCDSGREALRLLSERGFDLVLMDHMMPGMDGIEATREIRASRDERVRRTPVVALTANAVHGMRETFLGAGFSDYLSKPIDLAELDGILAKWLPVGRREAAAGGADGAGPAGLPEIPGIDSAACLRTLNGSRADYADFLRLFYADAARRLGFLEGPPGPGGLRGFVTAVHALKSAALNVGAAGLSARMRRLEEMGLAGDLDGIAGILPGVRGELVGLLQGIDRALLIGAEAAAPGGGGSPVSLDAGQLSMVRDLRGLICRDELALADELIGRIDDGGLDVGLLDRLAVISYRMHLRDRELALAEVDSLLAAGGAGEAGAAGAAGAAGG
ncbi:MAG: response regulator [Deltaproteobacteria bacterium]|jgi:signal transduction histidine kinase/CheY-like chemotaxis protein|nr:response regulator [Deltaproteobacteria bacterium]